MLITAIFAMAVLPCGVSAHPMDVSIAEIEFNAKAGMLEVALRLPADGLQQLMSDYDSTQDHSVEQHLEAILIQQFTIDYNHTIKLDLQWVGAEFANNYSWLYFQFPVKQSAGVLTISNQLLFDQQAAQANTIVFVSGKRRDGAVLSKDQPAHDFNL